MVGHIWLMGHSFLTLEDSNAYGQITITYNNIYESDKYNAEQKKSGGYTMHDCSCLNFNARQSNKNIVLEVRRVDITEGG